MSTAVAIFVKTPGLSPLKTRLAASIGQEKAHEFYNLSLNAIRETLTTLDISPYWAIAEKEALNDPMWQDYNRLHTGDGNLGVIQHTHLSKTLKSTRSGFTDRERCPAIIKGNPLSAP